MQSQSNRSTVALLVLFVAAALVLAGCSSSNSTATLGGIPAAEQAGSGEAGAEREAPATPISLAEVADSGKEGAAKACTASLSSPQTATSRLGLSGEEVPTNQGSEVSDPWKSASTGNFGSPAGSQRTLSCEFEGYRSSGLLYVVFGLNGANGENPFCGGSNPCVISDDTERYIALIDQTDDPKKANLNVEALKKILDRFAA